MSLFYISALSSEEIMKKEITLGAEDAWIPYANPNGTGMANEIISAAYLAVGIKVRYLVRPYNRLLKETKEGKVLGAFNVVNPHFMVQF